MTDSPTLATRLPDRTRLGWWALVLVLAGAMAFVAYTFVGLLVLGLFGYFATRPIYRRIDSYVDSDPIAGALTVSTVLVPVLVVGLYAVYRLISRLQAAFEGGAVSVLTKRVVGLEQVPAAQRQQIQKVFQNPASLLGGSGGSLPINTDLVMQLLQGVFGAVLLIALAVTLSYVLLVHDDRLSAVLVDLFGGTDTVAYAYAVAVDHDLESVFFGNLLFAAVMTVVATVSYQLTNVLAPGELHVPMVLVLGFLTGVTSLVPIVVGKLVYVPVLGYLGYQTIQAGGTGFGFVAAVGVAYLLVLDLLPQTFVQPYLSGRQVNPMVILFAFILGPTMFGWYGFFLLPILFVLAIQAVRIVLPELLHGRPLQAAPAIETEMGTDPRGRRDIDEEPTGSAATDGGSDDDSEGDSGEDSEQDPAEDSG